jgi:hypothetical protein
MTWMDRLRSAWNFVADSRAGRAVEQWGGRALTLAVGAYLAYRLTLIGWGDLWEALPRTPWFYVLFLAIYLSLPLFQAVIFGVVWSTSPWRLVPATLKKRIYNKDVLTYSGDVYLYLWGRGRLDRSDRQLFHDVKDTAIVSAVASTAVAFGVLAVLVGLDMVALPAELSRHGGTLGLATGVAGAVAAGLGLRFRGVLFGLPAAVLATVFGLHVLRLLLVKALQVLQWHVAVPEIGLGVWLTYLAVQIVASRIPFLPGRDLVFLAVGIEMAGALRVSEAAVAGVLGAHSVLERIANLLAFAAVSAGDRDDGPPAPSTGGGGTALDTDRGSDGTAGNDTGTSGSGTNGPDTSGPGVNGRAQSADAGEAAPTLTPEEERPRAGQEPTPPPRPDTP